MNPHRMSPSLLPEPTAVDLEITAELPVLDDANHTSDTWTIAATEHTAPVVAADAEVGRQLDSESLAVSARMREIQERLGLPRARNVRIPLLAPSESAITGVLEQIDSEGITGKKFRKNRSTRKRV
jgi:hypothetical protein